jgi:hypothetical protein
MPFWESIRESKDPSVFTVLLGEIGDVAGLIIAFLGCLPGLLCTHMFFNFGKSFVMELHPLTPDYTGLFNDKRLEKRGLQFSASL